MGTALGRGPDVDDTQFPGGEEITTGGDTFFIMVAAVVLAKPTDSASIICSC